MHVTLLWEAGAYLLLAATVIALGDGTSTSPVPKPRVTGIANVPTLKPSFLARIAEGFSSIVATLGA